MQKTFPRACLFPGTFDPFTLGHVDIINRGLSLFDKIYVGVGVNSQKSNAYFSTEKRKAWIKACYVNNPRVEGIIYEGLTVDCCKQVNANFILRGIRYVSDFEYEKTIADTNKSLAREIETIFLTCSPRYTSVASTIVREIYKNGGDVSSFLPEVVIDDLYPKSL